MSRILIVGCGFPQMSLIRLAKRLGHHVIGADMNPRAPAVQYCDEFVEVSTNDVDGLWNRGNSRSTSLALDVLTAPGGAELRTYVFTGDSQLTSGTSLTVGPGVIVKFETSARLYTNGDVSITGLRVRDTVLDVHLSPGGVRVVRVACG